jgi:hypothetical protein
MAKRFTATEKWEDGWFSELPIRGKLFWNYILDKCDAAGIWEKNFKVASFFIGETITENEALEWLGDKIIEFGENKWFIPNFILFQYGTLKPSCKPHMPIIAKLEKMGLMKYCENKGINTLPENAERVKEKEQVKEKEKDLNEGGVGETKKVGNDSPDEQEIIDFFLASGYEKKPAQIFFNYYEAQDWMTGGENPRKIKNWKSKARECMMTPSKFKWLMGLENQGNQNGTNKQSDKTGVTFNSRLGYKFDPDKAASREKELELVLNKGSTGRG